jgi:hypothetical protein
LHRNFWFHINISNFESCRSFISIITCRFIHLNYKIKSHSIFFLKGSDEKTIRIISCATSQLVFCVLYIFVYLVFFCLKKNTKTTRAFLSFFNFIINVQVFARTVELERALSASFARSVQININQAIRYNG